MLGATGQVLETLVNVGASRQWLATHAFGTDAGESAKHVEALGAKRTWV